jgi:hypothetical protein
MKTNSSKLRTLCVRTRISVYSDIHKKIKAIPLTGTGGPTDSGDASLTRRRALSGRKAPVRININLKIYDLIGTKDG